MRPTLFVAGVAMNLSLRGGSEHRQRDRNVAARRLGIGADGMGVLDEGLDFVLIGARNGNLEIDFETEAGGILIEGDGASPLRRRAVDSMLLAESEDRRAVAGRIAQREKLFR